MYELYDKEKEVMEIFWRLDKPCLISEILRESSSLSRSTVSKVLVRLEEKGFLKVDSIRKSITKAGRAYVPIISKKEYEVQEKFLQYSPDNEKLPVRALKLTCCLLQSRTVDDAFIAELEQMIEDYKNSPEE